MYVFERKEAAMSCTIYFDNPIGSEEQNIHICVCQDLNFCSEQPTAAGLPTDQRDLIARGTARLLIAIGQLLITQPAVSTDIESHTGQKLISFGRKLIAPSPFEHTARE